MANDLFGGFGSLVKGLSGLMPQDDPQVKIFNATTQISDLKTREQEIYANIGKRALGEYGRAAFPEEAGELDSIHAQLQKAEQALQVSNAEAAEKEKAEQALRDSLTCPSCGTVNAEGMKFCQECGARLGIVSKVICPKCHFENTAGTRFCGECGAKLGE